MLQLGYLLREDKSSFAGKCFEQESFFYQSPNTVVHGDTVEICLRGQLIYRTSTYMDTCKIDLRIGFLQPYLVELVQQLFLIEF